MTTLYEKLTGNKAEHYQFSPPAESDVNTVDRYRSTVLPGQDKIYPRIANLLWPKNEHYWSDEVYHNYNDTR